MVSFINSATYNVPTTFIPKNIKKVPAFPSLSKKVLENAAITRIPDQRTMEATLLAVSTAI